jgi:uncharacterized protein YecE (DUF72 family)
MARAKRARAGRTFVGTSGWVYRSWREHLYRGVPTRAWLAHASSTFDSLEINGSFYRQISPATYQRWRSETPPGFRFALKGHRFVTHYKRLRDVDRSIALLRDAASALGDKLAVVIWQLPGNFTSDPERLRGFVRSLGAWSAVRHAIELRHRSWFTEEVEEILREAQVASCMSDAPDFPLWRAVTTDLVYVRLHGHSRKYASSYTRPHLRRWAADAEVWAREGRDVYVYFDNDAEGAAVRNALTLLEELGRGNGRTARAKSSAPRVFRTSPVRTRARRAIPTASSM